MVYRLTDKGRFSGNIDEDISGNYCPNCSLSECIEKLGQLEDIEEELGIDLLILFKALKNGVFAKTKRGIQKLYCRHFTLCNFEATTNKKWGYIEHFYHTYHYKDYGKTWALTREELEK